MADVIILGGGQEMPENYPRIQRSLGPYRVASELKKHGYNAIVIDYIQYLSVEEIINNAYHKKDKEVLLIKLFDRLHNIQTIESIKTEKQKKIAEETLKYVAIISTEFDDISLEEYIYMSSYKIIATKQDYDFYYKKYHRLLVFDDYRLPSPTFENN